MSEQTEKDEKKDSELPPAARRALDEARARREALEAEEGRLEAERADEEGGPSGKEPTRYGDWERKGIAYDF
jgi:hypothetical protein